MTTEQRIKMLEDQQDEIIRVINELKVEINKRFEALEGK